MNRATYTLAPKYWGGKITLVAGEQLDGGKHAELYTIDLEKKTTLVALDRDELLELAAALMKAANEVKE